MLTLQRILEANRGYIVSEGTLHPYDIYHAWRDAFERFAEEPYKDEVLNQLELIPMEAHGNRNHPFWESELLNWDISEILFDALNKIAPEGYYFSSSEGDGALFGFWKVQTE